MRVSAIPERGRVSVTKFGDGIHQSLGILSTS